jgi:2-polyprenyl-3-methyl-5-hydroxy-6-metoxy-1,4-benzoquinol methylase
MAPRIRYQTYQFGELDIHLCTLKDTQQFHDPRGEAHALGIDADTWALFGVVWTTAEILAQLMMDIDIVDKRILEVGCGIGLASHVLNHRGADISATDIHPEVERFLEINVALNQSQSIPFLRSAWHEESASLGQFDLIVASDVLYEPMQALPLADFVTSHANQSCEVLIVDANRGVDEKFSDAMVSRGFSHEATTPPVNDQLDLPFTGTLHRFYR